VKIWSEYAYGKCHHLILDAIARRRYDLYLLCHTDLPWTPDPLREYPDPQARQELFLMYKDLLVAQSIPFVDIKGTDDQRLIPAIKAIDQLFLRP
jgi:nicotinamide riboside kinase